MAIIVFLVFVVFVIGLSLYLGNKAKTSSGYYAAGGKIHWGVNGIAFAGDYLSAASFLGICGMIATVGYDGFLYSIGYLAGWIVALFVVAEPLKRLGKYTFTDAVDANYNSRGIKLAAAISTLVVSICYLIPQMVGAGVLVEPLLGIPHSWGVLMVGAIVITIVATAGMASTTYVQFLKGGLLIIFSTVLVGAVIVRGLSTHRTRVAKFPSMSMPISSNKNREPNPGTEAGCKFWSKKKSRAGWCSSNSAMMEKKPGGRSLKARRPHGCPHLNETQSVVVKADGKWINGAPASATNQLRQVGNLEKIHGESDVETGSLSLFGFLSTLTDKDTIAQTWKTASFVDSAGEKVTVYYSSWFRVTASCAPA